MLDEEKDEDYCLFQSALIPCSTPLIGVRIPILRRIKKEIENSSSKEEMLSLFSSFCPHSSIEEDILQGFFLMDYPFNFEEKKEIFQKYTGVMDNWETCDLISTLFLIPEDEKEECFNWIMDLAETSNHPFTIRSMLVIALTKYVQKNNLKKLYSLIDKINSSSYYVEMGIAWLLSVMATIDFEGVVAYLKRKECFSIELKKKTIQKIVDSYRISDENKQIVKNWRKTLHE
jgi:3-methyladenine DNA glycosylase AlkD